MSPAQRAGNWKLSTSYPLLPAVMAGFFWPMQGQISQFRHKRGYRIRKMESVLGCGMYPCAVLPKGIPMLTMLLLISGYRVRALLKPGLTNELEA
jgi:hypothetical protein